MCQLLSPTQRRSATILSSTASMTRCLELVSVINDKTHKKLVHCTVKPVQSEHCGALYEHFGTLYSHLETLIIIMYL